MMNHPHRLWTFGSLLLITLAPTASALAGKRAEQRRLRAERATVVADSLAFEQARQEARRDYFYFAALQNRVGSGRLLTSFDLLRYAADVDSTSAPVAYTLAEYYERLGDQPTALRLASMAARRDTTNLWYGLMEAGLLQRLHRPAEATRCYERLLRVHPDNMQLCEQLVNLYLDADSLRPCLSVLDHVEATEGIDARRTMQKFYIYMQLGEPDSAAAATQRLVDQFPHETSYRILQGNLMMQAGRLDEAKSSFDQAEAIDPNDAMLWMAQANYYNAVGQEAKGDSLIRAAVTRPELELDQKIEILTAYLKRTLAQRATEDSLDVADTASDVDAQHLASIDSLFAAVSAMHPTDAEPYQLHGAYLEAIGQNSAALRCYRDAVDLKPSEQDYWMAYLQSVAETQDTALIRHEAAEAVEIHPDLIVGHILLAQTSMAAQRPKEAIAHYRDGIAQMRVEGKTLRSTLYGYVGDVFQTMGLMDSTYAAYDEALRYNAENVMVLNNYSYFLALEGRDLDRAERMMGTVIRLKPDEPTYLDTYAWVYFKQGNYTLAKFYQRRAIDRSAGEVSATLLEHYGDILSCSGDSAGALEYWQRAAAAPDNTSKTLDEKLRTGVYIEEPFTPGAE
jgi:tetratricopeptide (TPR) repeat protein